MKKILIGIVTYNKKDYCKERFLDRLDSIDPLRNHEIKVIDNTDFPEKNPKKRLCEARNMLIDYFLKTDCDYLFHLEADVLPPQNVIYSLSKWDKKIVCGWYYIGQQRGEEGSYMTPCLSSDKRPLNEMDLCKEKLLKVFVGALGCCLIHRSIFENGYRFWVRDDLKMMDDGAFWYDMWEKGIDVFVDTDMLCIHFPDNYREIK